MKQAENAETFVICKQKNRYMGWPTVAKTEDGQILVVFSGDRDEHVCPYGKTFLVRSNDDGRSWSEPELINNTPLDDRDAGIVVLKSGVIIVSWFTSLVFEVDEYHTWIKDDGVRVNKADWKKVSAQISNKDRYEWLGSFSRRSEDGGKTWGEPIMNVVSSSHGPVQLSDGRLLYMGTLMPFTSNRIGVEESRDDGRTWQVIGEVPRVPEAISGDVEMCEPHICETADGRLIAVIRKNCAVEERGLYQTESIDGGRTWSLPKEILHKDDQSLKGYPPHLLRLKDGRMLLVYGYRLEPFGERALISYDDGKTWDVENEIVICESQYGDLGYPASVELSDGKILTVFYQVENDDEKPCLMGTIWTA